MENKLLGTGIMYSTYIIGSLLGIAELAMYQDSGEVGLLCGAVCSITGGLAAYMAAMLMFEENIGKGSRENQGYLEEII